VGRLERGWRWCRRNRLAACLLAVLAMMTTISILLALTAFEHAEEATKQRSTAERGQERAEEGEQKAKEQTTGAEKARKEAEKARKEAEKLRKEAEAAKRDAIARAREAGERARVVEFIAYASLLREAQGEIRRGRLAEAMQVLKLCEAKSRGWEHDYL